MKATSRFSLTLFVALSLRAEILICQRCHPKESAGYAQFGMAHSLRRAQLEPAGSFQTADGTKFTVHFDQGNTWQRIEQSGQTAEYRVDYVIGSGKHAAGYLVRMGDHLFQSPIAYYPSRHAYDLAPGFENKSEPDFTRPVTVECLLCHSGKPLPVPSAANRYESPAFAKEAISCERCHGPVAEHLKHPLPGSIVNPAKLNSAARDSVCEQCHLSGRARVLNPGKSFADFVPGERLEEVFTVYCDAWPEGSPQERLKVISHPEQLAASACARLSAGRLWCGTCHDPHNKHLQDANYYSERCLSCHRNKLPKAHIAGETGDCIACHMPRREAFDGGHTVFTDHRIASKPQIEMNVSDAAELVAWREPEAPFSKRNLALAYLNSGLERRSPAWIVRGYRMLTEIQNEFPNDPAVFNGFGSALMQGNQPCEAKIAFNRLLAVDRANPANQENAGRAELACGDIAAAVKDLEKALELDPLALSAAEVLQAVYRKTGDYANQEALARRIRVAMNSTSALTGKALSPVMKQSHE